MTCGGCSNAIKKILGKIEGVADVDANVEEKLVKVLLLFLLFSLCIMMMLP